MKNQKGCDPSLEQPSLWSPWNPTLWLSCISQVWAGTAPALKNVTLRVAFTMAFWEMYWILFAEIKSDGGEYFPARWETPQPKLSDLMCYKWTVKSSLMHVVGHRVHQPRPFPSYCQKDLDCQSTRLFGRAGCLQFPCVEWQDCNSQLPFEPDLMLVWESVGEECSGSTANFILYRILAFPLSYVESFLLQIGERKIKM